jgi:aspartate/methionine/tyrosine aminotransferase
MAPIRSVIARMESQRIAEVARVGMERPDVIALWFGESDVDTPDFIRQAATAAMNEGRTFYVHRRGVLALRRELQSYLARLHGVTLDLERITVAASGMTAIMIALQCLVDNGDNVVVVSPIWPNIVYGIEAMGGTCRHVRLDAVDGKWSLDMNKLFAACDSRTRAIFVASPGNPSGWIMERAQQQELLEFCRARDIWIISDEVYSRLVFDREGSSPSFLEICTPDDPLFVVQSFSKNWAMTGWRLGWLVHPDWLGDRAGDLSAINNTGATSFVQYAGIAALSRGDEFVRNMIERCRRGRELAHARLAAMPRVRSLLPQAAFYAFFQVEGIEDDLAFAKELVRTAGVGLAPGSAFGPGNEGYLRLCFAVNEERLSAALDRLERALPGMR